MEVKNVKKDYQLFKAKKSKLSIQADISSAIIDATQNVNLEANGNISSVAKTISLCGENLAVYSGNDDQIVPIMSLGGLGVISVLSNLLPYEEARQQRT